ncbi:MAG: glycosyltransferase family 39 protein [Acidimicrobiales bacterium]
MTAATEEPTRPRPAGASGWLRAHWYGVGVAIAALIGAVIRFVNVLVWYPTCDLDIVRAVEDRVPYVSVDGSCFRIWGDSAYYYLQGRLMARGHLYVDSATWYRTGGTTYVDSAGDPPLYSLFLGALSKLGITSGTGQRLATSLVGIAAIVLIAMVARRVFGRRAGIVAAVLAAVYPRLWINDGMLLSEGVYVALVALVLLAAYRLWERPGWASAVLLGGAIGLAALTRGEGLLIFGFLVIPLVWGLRELTLGRRALLALVTWVVGGLLLLPWIAFNLSRFEEPVFMTSQTGAVLSAANCDTTFYGDYIGYYANCYDEYVAAGRAEWPDVDGLDESQRDKYSRDAAIAYIKDNKGRLPVVAVARVARMFDLYNPELFDTREWCTPELGCHQELLGQNVRLNWMVEGRGIWASRIGFVMYFVLLGLAVPGAVVLYRRRIPISPLMAMPVLITVTSAFTFGITRYRVPVDVTLVILAAVTVDWLLRRRWPAPDDGTITRLRGRRDVDGSVVGPTEPISAEPTTTDA